MKKIRNAVDAFCRKHPYFGPENLMKYLMIANIALWLLNAVNPLILRYMTFNPYYIFRGQIWRLVSFVFIPPSTGVLAFIAFYFYYWIGTTLEREWGTARFNVYFFSGVLLTVLYGIIMYFVTGQSFSVNAEFIYLSMFFSFAALYPDMQVLLFYFIPVKIKWLAYVDAALFVMNIFTTSFPANLLPVIAILNFLIFCGDDLIDSLGLKKKSPTAINFKKASREIKKEQARSLYHHKCSVCGRTDTDYPDLEFRYCSQCVGYHCFCSDHINSHIHFQE